MFDLIYVLQVESFDTTSGVVVCESGIILDTLEKHVEKFGYTIPLDLGAKGRYTKTEKEEDVIN